MSKNMKGLSFKIKFGGQGHRENNLRSEEVQLKHVEISCRKNEIHLKKNKNRIHALHKKLGNGILNISTLVQIYSSDHRIKQRIPSIKKSYSTELYSVSRTLIASQ